MLASPWLLLTLIHSHRLKFKIAHALLIPCLTILPPMTMSECTGMLQARIACGDMPLLVGKFIYEALTEMYLKTEQEADEFVFSSLPSTDLELTDVQGHLIDMVIFPSITTLLVIPTVSPISPQLTSHCSIPTLPNIPPTL